MSLKRYDFSTEVEDFSNAATVSDWGQKSLQIGIHQIRENGRVESSSFAYTTLEGEESLRNLLNERHAERQPKVEGSFQNCSNCNGPLSPLEGPLGQGVQHCLNGCDIGKASCPVQE